MAIFSKRSLDGYLMVDHRAGDGLGDMRGLFETAIATCSHCQRGVIRNHARSRERCWCSVCDHYICDECGIVRAQTGQCRTFKQVMDEQEKRAILASKEQADG
jgi:hypothetical protein